MAYNYNQFIDPIAQGVQSHYDPTFAAQQDQSRSIREAAYERASASAVANSDNLQKTFNLTHPELQSKYQEQYGDDIDKLTSVLATDPGNHYASSKLNKLIADKEHRNFIRKGQAWQATIDQEEKDMDKAPEYIREQYYGRVGKNRKIFDKDGKMKDVTGPVSLKGAEQWDDISKDIEKNTINNHGDKSQINAYVNNKLHYILSDPNKVKNLTDHAAFMHNREKYRMYDTGLREDLVDPEKMAEYAKDMNLNSPEEARAELTKQIEAWDKEKQGYFNAELNALTQGYMDKNYKPDKTTGGSGGGGGSKTTTSSENGPFVPSYWKAIKDKETLSRTKVLQHVSGLSENTNPSVKKIGEQEYVNVDQPNSVQLYGKWDKDQAKNAKNKEIATYAKNWIYKNAGMRWKANGEFKKNNNGFDGKLILTPSEWEDLETALREKFGHHWFGESYKDIIRATKTVDNNMLINAFHVIGNNLSEDISGIYHAPSKNKEERINTLTRP